MRIVDEWGREAGDRTEGRLEFRGPSATSGYFRNEAKTRALFHDGWLDTGDRAYIADADLFVTGRTKDIIIRAGQHIYPHEVEEALGEIAGIRRGGVAVFGIPDTASGTERMIVVAETRETDPALREQLRASAQKAAAEIVGAPAEDIVLVAPGTVPKTSSGKLRRAAAKELYAAGLLQAAQPPLRRQLLRLWLAGVGPQLSRLRRTLSDRLYAAWWWTVMGTCFALGWPAVMLLPRRQWRWKALHWLSVPRFLPWAYPCRSPAFPAFRANGQSSCSITQAIWTGSSSSPFSPCADLRGKAGTRWTILRRKRVAPLGNYFVERYDLSGSLADTAAATKVAREGRLLVIFPEGDVYPETGTSGISPRPFQDRLRRQPPGHSRRHSRNTLNVAL